MPPWPSGRSSVYAPIVCPASDGSVTAENPHAFKKCVTLDRCALAEQCLKLCCERSIFAPYLSEPLRAMRRSARRAIRRVEDSAPATASR